MFRIPPEARVTGAGRVTAPHHVIRTFDHRCRHYGWQGSGSDLSLAEVHENSWIVDYGCLRCGDSIGFSYPTDAEGWPV